MYIHNFVDIHNQGVSNKLKEEIIHDSNNHHRFRYDLSSEY